MEETIQDAANSMNDSVKKICNNIAERVSKPFFLSFIIAWVAWNFKFILIIFSSENINEKIKMIEYYTHIANYISFPWSSQPYTWWENVIVGVAHIFDFFVIPFGIIWIIYFLYQKFGVKYSRNWNKLSHSISLHSQQDFENLEKEIEELGNDFSSELENYQQVLLNLKEQAGPYKASLGGILKFARQVLRLRVYSKS
ncbi:hypothetical protein AAEX28_14215 [Lentisphaerota bacterium WC36G]|nr:hypothetical protein LJT99_00970 [Lentisphaerae bacterium WC36]